MSEQTGRGWPASSSVEEPVTAVQQLSRGGPGRQGGREGGREGEAAELTADTLDQRWAN